jgi:transposase
MAKERLPMHRVREVLRLKNACRLSNRKIALACSVDRDTVGMYLKRAEKAGLGWPLLESLTDCEIEARLFPKLVQKPPGSQRALPDCQYIYEELRSYKKKVSLTLMQLWFEYKESHPEGYQYTQFCEYYRRWRGKLDYCMRQEHRAGEKVFVDYCGGPAIVDQETGEVRSTQMFVAVWGASNYTFAEATLTQSLPHWTSSHVRALEYFGCAPSIFVPDNLKSGVVKASLYEPELNRSYAELAAHYGCAVIPARPYKPRDKAKVEAGVLVVQRWIMAVLRHRVFFNIADLNAAIAELLERLNARALRKVKKSRRELFETLDRPNAKTLPARPYEYAEWTTAKVSLNYHVELERHNYSVPFRLLHEQLDARLTATMVEVFYKHERVACHARSWAAHKYTTLKEHMPPEHQKHLEWTPTRIIEWAGKTGPGTALLVERIMSKRDHPEQGYKSCLGILRHLLGHYGAARVEAAAGRALEFNTCSYTSMRSILLRGLDRQAKAGESAQTALPFHANVRGGKYYH